MRCAVSSTVFLVAVVTGVFTSSVVADQPPHIVLIMADDLGWGDVGYHGSEIATPHIDCLAHSGVRLNQFYVHPARLLADPRSAADGPLSYPLGTAGRCRAAMGAPRTAAV